AQDCSEEAAPCRAKILCAKVADDKIEDVRNQCEQHKNDHRLQADALLRADHGAMDDCGSENNSCAGKSRNDRADQTDGEEDDREEPPEEFHGNYRTVIREP